MNEATDGTATASSADAGKRAAAERALGFVEDGMTVGLGSGSTAELFLAALARRVRGGLRVRVAPTSERVAGLARSAGIPLVDSEELPPIAVTVDGADEVDPAFNLIKGRGGALLREKLVATASDRMIVIVDESKLVRCLGERQSVPVAVVRFGWRQTAARLERLGCAATLRLAEGGAPYVTDDNTYVLDCRFGPIAQPARLAEAIKGLLGVVEHGLFVGIASRVIVGGAGGARVLDRAGAVV
ncbi:MAG: ribose-5-phosphate isomerase RpiA [Chloroflexota bacterium]|nr:ribose-5-phosphate isomerase RpiA [Chloroflexota bacterium]